MTPTREVAQLSRHGVSLACQSSKTGRHHIAFYTPLQRSSLKSVFITVKVAWHQVTGVNFGAHV